MRARRSRPRSTRPATPAAPRYGRPAVRADQPRPGALARGTSGHRPAANALPLSVGVAFELRSYQLKRRRANARHRLLAKRRGLRDTNLISVHVQECRKVTMSTPSLRFQPEAER